MWHKTNLMVQSRLVTHWRDLIMCLDTQLEVSLVRHKPFHNQLIFASVYSPSSPYWSEGLVDAPWGQPLAPCLPADARPSCCGQGTRKGCILQHSVRWSTGSHVGKITTGRNAATSARKLQTPLHSCHLLPYSQQSSGLSCLHTTSAATYCIAHGDNNSHSAVWTATR